MTLYDQSNRQSAPTIQLRLDRPTGNFWIDNGLVVLCSLMGEGEHPINEVLDAMLQRLVQKTGNKGFYFDERSGELREYEKVNWVYPTNLFIKVSGKSGKKIEIDGRKYPTQPPIFDLRLQLGKASEICDICGREGPTESAKMWMFPFVVDPDKFANFYPGVKQGLKLCPHCALAGLAGYLGWCWWAHGRDAIHIFVFHTDLHELKRLHREVLEPLKKESKGGNISIAFGGPYLHETTWGLLLELFSYVRSSEGLSRSAQKFLGELLGATPSPRMTPVTLYVITGVSGKAFNMQEFRSFSHLQSLYRLYEAWLQAIGSKSDNPHQSLVAVFRQFQTREGNEYNTIWREKVAWAILEFTDPLPYVESFLFDAKAKEKNPSPLAWGTEQVLELYTKEVLAMEETMLKVLSGFGHRLGAVSHEKNEMGLLYALRNAKNPEEFYRVLNDIQFRLELTVPEELLQISKGEKIAGSPWVRVKTLLSIYAMNTYLWRKQEQP